MNEKKDNKELVEQFDEYIKKTLKNSAKPIDNRSDFV